MRSRTPDEIAEAVAQYVSGLTILDVAQLYGTNEATVSGWVRDAGATRPRGSTQRMREITRKRTAALLDLNTSGDTLTAVARRHGIAASTLDAWRRIERGLAYEGEWVRVGGILRGTTRDVA